MALTRALDVAVRIEYLNGRPYRDHLEQIILPEGGDKPPKVTLLYRYVGYG